MPEMGELGTVEDTIATAVSEIRTPRSFEEFFESEKADLYSALCLITRNRHQAEELTQDAFVRVLEHWDRVAEMESPVGYLYTIAMNEFRKGHRRAIAGAKRTLGLTPADDGISEIDARDATVRALAPLSPRQRAAVVLIDLLGYPSEEAARMLGIRASTVRQHASRAHAVLKQAMKDIP